MTLRNYYKLIFKLKSGSCKGTVTINALTKVTQRTHVGNNFNSNGMIVIGKGEVRIGDNFHCGYGCVMITENHNFKSGKRIPYDDTFEIKSIHVGDNVWFGIDVKVLPGVEIGEGAIVQAGAVVIKDVEPLAIVGGNPAVKFSERDSEHYYKLKLEQKFF